LSRSGAGQMAGDADEDGPSANGVVTKGVGINVVSGLRVATSGPSAVKLVEVWPRGDVGCPVPRERYGGENEGVRWGAQGNTCFQKGLPRRNVPTRGEILEDEPPVRRHRQSQGHSLRIPIGQEYRYGDLHGAKCVTPLPVRAVCRPSFAIGA